MAAGCNLEAQVFQTASITGASVSQSAQNVNGNTPAPSRTTITTESFLKQLARDEFAAEAYGSNVFPAGARLNYSSGTGFQVVDRHNNLLVNVSSVLYLQVIGSNDISSSIAAGGWLTTTDNELCSLTYDATQIGGSTQFTVSGAGKWEDRFSNATAQGNYTEIDSFSLQDGVGEGLAADGSNIILTGFAMRMSGSAVQYNGLGVSGSDSFTLTTVPITNSGPGGVEVGNMEGSIDTTIIGVAIPVQSAMTSSAVNRP